MMKTVKTMLRRAAGFIAVAAVVASGTVALTGSTPANAAISCPLAKGHPPVTVFGPFGNLICGGTGDPPPPPSGGPTPAPYAPSDINALVAISNSFTGACVGSDRTCTNHIGIVGNYALVGFTDKVNSGEYFLATNTSGSWTVIQKAGGWLIQSELQSLSGLSASDAAALEAASSADWNGQ